MGSEMCIRDRYLLDHNFSFTSFLTTSLYQRSAEPELVTFTDRHGQDLATTMAGIPNDNLHLPAIDDSISIPGVDMDSDELAQPPPAENDVREFSSVVVLSV